MNSLYLLINVGVILFPFLFSFEKQIHFIKYIKPIIVSILFTWIVFIPWDSVFTMNGIWGFNSNYLLGVEFFNLPLEEWMFFITVPYSLLFIYEIICRIDYKLNRIIQRLILHAIVGYHFLLLITSGSNLYTLSTSLVVLIFTISLFFFNKLFVSNFLWSYLIILIPFIIINGILTGYITEEPIVWYDNKENLGIRFLTIPIEDFSYNFLLFGSSVLPYYLMTRNEKRERLTLFPSKKYYP